MKSIAQDFRFAYRLARVAPLTAILAIVSLALAIAASTILFSVVYTVFLRSPLFQDANRLVVIWESNPVKGISKTPFASATFRAGGRIVALWRDWSWLQAALRSQLLAQVFPERANLQYASPGLFKLLGVQPVLGRFFVDSDVTNSDTPCSQSAD